MEKYKNFTKALISSDKNLKWAAELIGYTPNGLRIAINKNTLPREMAAVLGKHLGMTADEISTGEGLENTSVPKVAKEAGALYGRGKNFSTTGEFIDYMYSNADALVALLKGNQNT